MKKTQFISTKALWLMLFGGVLSTQLAFGQQDYLVKGKIAGWPGKYIHFESQGNSPKKDSVLNKDGSFEFRGKVDGVTNAFLVAKGIDQPTFKFIFLEPGEIHINGTFDHLKEAKVTGSPNTTQYEEVKLKHALLNKKLDSLYNLLEGSPEVSKKDSWRASIVVLQNEDEELSKAFIKQYPTNPGAVYELAGLSEKIDYTELKALHDLLDPKLKQSVQAKEVNQLVESLGNVELGKIATEIAQPDTTGKVIKLSDFRGKYVLVDFWASWCIPCRRENPNLAEAYTNYKGKGFEILGVSIDSKAEEWRWKRAIKNDAVTWTQISDLKGNKNAAAQAYAVQTIPANFLIDPTGKIIAKNLMGEKLQEKLKELFQ